MTNGPTLSVSQLNDYIKGLLGDDILLRGLSLRGEISGFRRHSSGHLYFAIKDENAVMRCVMFRQNALPLRFAPRDGLRVVLSGYVSFYTRDGALQFYCEGMKPDGVGALYQAFEELKEKLKAEGLFEQKRPLPAFPRRVAVVTSPTGAAVRDVLRVSGRRNPGLDIVVVPAKVQGEGAAKSVADAIAKAGKLARVDVVICGRGGGSIEDLWCFNEEIVARAIVACPVPVVAGIGHETDFTIADFAADVRAATPSNAAELAVPDISVLAQRRDEAFSRMRDAMARQLRSCDERLRRAADSRVLENLAGILKPKAEKLAHLVARMETAARTAADLRSARLDAIKMRLSALSPVAVLKRGYSIVSDEAGRAVTTPDSVAVGARVSIRMAAGSMSARREG